MEKMDSLPFTLELQQILESAPKVNHGITCAFLLRGTVELKIDEASFSLSEDDLVIINDKQLYAFKGEAGNLMLALSIGREQLQQECGALAGNYLHCNGASKEIPDEGTYFELRRIIIDMFTTKMDKPYAYLLHLKMSLLRFLYLLYTTCSGVALSPAARQLGSGGTNVSESAIFEYIQQNCQEHMSLQDIAAHFFLSPAYFSKLFKKAAGMGYFQYLQKTRVERAVNQLLYSNDTILQIAIDNGFSSANSFAKYFMQHHGMAPSDYRKQYQATKKDFSAPREKLISLEGAQKKWEDVEFLRYIKKYDLGVERPALPVETHRINIGSTPLRTLRPMENMIFIDIDTIALLKDYDLWACKDDLNIKYAYFQLLGETQYKQITGLGPVIISQRITAINAIYQYGLTPFMRIDFSDQVFTGTDEEILAYTEQGLRPLLEAFQDGYSAQRTKAWKFEIVCDKFDASQAALFYKTVWTLLYAFFPEASIGLFADTSTEGVPSLLFSFLLEQGTAYGAAPDFITFHAFQNRAKKKHPKDALFYSHCVDYHAKIASSITQACLAQKISVPLYLTVWNTLSGESPAEIQLYSRGGLIMDALMALYNTVQGVGYGLFTSACAYSGEPYASALDLYLLYKSRRPVYYVANFIDRLCGALLYQTKQIAAGLNQDGELILVVWNPQYLNPAHCMDMLLTNSLSINLHTEITGLENRVYTIKRFIVDYENSGALAQHYTSGFPDGHDKDAISFMNNDNRNFYLFTMEAANGALVLHTNIRYNGVVMYVIK